MLIAIANAVVFALYDVSASQSVHFQYEAMFTMQAEMVRLC